MLLAKLFLIGYNSLALIVGLSEFRISSFKRIDKKKWMIELILKELENEKCVSNENTYRDEIVRDKALGRVIIFLLQVNLFKEIVVKLIEGI